MDRGAARKLSGGKLDPLRIPEVVAFLDAKDQYDAFKEQHHEIFEELQLLADQYNAALEAAEKVVRARGVSCGPFDAYQTSVTYDAGALFDAVGEDRFVSMGGKIVTRQTYEVDKDRLESLYMQGKLPEEVVLAARRLKVNYHKPQKVSVP